MATIGSILFVIFFHELARIGNIDPNSLVKYAKDLELVHEEEVIIVMSK